MFKTAFVPQQQSGVAAAAWVFPVGPSIRKVRNVRRRTTIAQLELIATDREPHSPCSSHLPNQMPSFPQTSPLCAIFSPDSPLTPQTPTPSAFTDHHDIDAAKFF